jgi:hypothetical protein
MPGVLQPLAMTDIVILTDDRVNWNASIEWEPHVHRVQEEVRFKYRVRDFSFLKLKLNSVA